MVFRNKAGTSFGDGGIQQKYGAQAAAAGLMGEQLFYQLLEKYGISRDYDIWFSLRIPNDPSNPHATRYNSDVDVAIASGNKLILIDVKRWAAGYHYWSLFGLPFKGLTPITKNGSWKLGANMAGAQARFQANLKGMRVESMVVFVSTNSRGAAPSSVALLKWPGGIKSYLYGAAIPKIKSILGKPQRVNPKIESLLEKMARR